MRKLLMLSALVFCLGSGSTRAQADTISFNISNMAGFQSNGIGGIFGSGIVELSPQYTAAFGATVDFGIAHLTPHGPDNRVCTPTNPSGCFANYLYKAYFLTNGSGGLEEAPFDLYSNNVPAAIRGGEFVSCPYATLCSAISIPLQFTLPADVNGIQFAFEGGRLSIAAPVPESSTWAMLLIGFAGMGFMAYRRKRNVSSPSLLPDCL